MCDLVISAKSLPLQALMLFKNLLSIRVRVLCSFFGPAESDIRTAVVFAPFSPLPADKKDVPDPKALTTLSLQNIVEV